MSTGRIVHVLAAGAVALGLSAVGLAAQTEDARWLPWVGCWESVGGTAEDPMLCFRPATEGVEVLTIQDGTLESAQTLRADGQAHRVEVEGCSGTESVSFSTDGARVYQNSRQACDGGTERAGSGIIAMIAPDAWIDVKSVEVEGQVTAWVTHYRLASAERVEGLGLDALVSPRRMAIETARVSVARPPAVDDVIDASAQVHVEAVRAWIAEAAEPMEVGADELIRLADAGVSPEIIDVVVAVSYPEHFVVGRDADVAEVEGTRAATRPTYGSATGRARMCTPFAWDPFYASFLGYGNGCGYGYGYGLAYGGGFGRGLYGYSPYGHRPGPIVIIPRGDDDNARVVNGRGYTRGTAANPPSTSRPTTRTGSPPTVSRGAGASTGSASGSTGSTTRRAKPRGGGGGGL